MLTLESYSSVPVHLLLGRTSAAHLSLTPATLDTACRGTSTRTCSGGVWTGATPTCVRVGKSTSSQRQLIYSERRLKHILKFHLSSNLYLHPISQCLLVITCLASTKNYCRYFFLCILFLAYQKDNLHYILCSSPMPRPRPDAQRGKNWINTCWTHVPGQFCAHLHM